MNLIGVIVTDAECIVVEADYLQFVLDLTRRVGAAADGLRPGLPVVDETKQYDYSRYMMRHLLDPAELAADWQSLSRIDREESAPEFFPSVLINFKTREVHVSHPDASYLNLGAYLPSGWRFIETVANDLMKEVPAPCRYWESTLTG